MKKTYLLGIHGLLFLVLAVAGPWGCGGPATGGDGGSTDGSSDGGDSPSGGDANASRGEDRINANLTACADGGPFAFPGAEGWGACASGGRGGSVCYVTTNDVDSAGTTPGSFQYCLNQPRAAYILFKTSGVIDGTVTSVYPNKTIAGQTSPGGITVRGFLCDNGIYEPTYRCNNMILRNFRSRPGSRGEDGLRLDGSRNIMVDRVSIENAVDESVQVSRASSISIQNSIIAEPIGDHFYLGGMLINYSATEYPLDNLSFHHNLWSRLGGRMPEISCEENSLAGERDGGPLTSNCAGNTRHLDLVSNLLWDQHIQIYYNECTGTNQGNPSDGACSGHQSVHLNWIGNASFGRSGFSGNVLMDELYETTTASNRIHATDNTLNGAATEGSASTSASRLSSPAITVTPSSSLVAYMQTNAGTFPRDTMDARIIDYIDDPIDGTPRNYSGTAVNGETTGTAVGDAYTVTAPTVSFPADTDNDGMPDAWETAHGLNPSVDDHNTTTLSTSGGDGIAGCTAGYTNIECYLNELAAHRIGGTY